MVDDSDVYAETLIRMGIFNLDDLEVNRSGHLSDRQKRRLFIDLAFWLGIGIIEVIVLIAFVSIQIVNQGNLLVGIIGITLLLVLMSMCLEEAKPFWEDIKEDKPKTASGGLHKSMGISHGPGKGQRIAHCSVRVGDHIFSVSPVTYDHIGEHAHRIYYVANTNRVINIEPL